MDNEGIKKNNQSLKIQLSIASLMFFYPFIKQLLKTNSFELEKDELDFVESYIYLWKISIILLIITLVSWLSAHFYTSNILITIYQTITILLIILLFVWCVWAITETKIINKSLVGKQWNVDYKNDNKLESILSYIPGYSIYLWYNKHNFDKPDLFLKESMLLWILFGVSCFFPAPIITIFILIAIIIRIVTLLWNINIIPLSISEIISWLFYKNPEEIRAYVWWSVVFIFHGNYNIPYWKLIIEEQKKEYQYLYDIKKFWTIQWQYWLLMISIIIVLRQVDLWNIWWLSIFAILLLLARYWTMLFVWWRSPDIPIMREIVGLANVIIKPFTSKK